ncbi:MAG: sensor histidine kinase [Pararhizobium sp.]
MRWPRSLRLQLLTWLVVPLAVAASINVWTTLSTAESVAGLVTGQKLISSARAIAEATVVEDGSTDAVIPPVALEMFSTGYQDSVFYRVETDAGRLLAGYPDLPPPEKALGGFEPILYRGVYRDRPVMLVALRHPVAGSPGGVIHVFVGVTLAAHESMLRRLWLGGFSQQVILIVLAGTFAVVGLSRGLRPLLALRDAVLRRETGNLEPLGPHPVQSELQPLVAALDEYMGRVRGQMAAQRRFVANAAHQFRTPIALLNTQATYALRSRDADERDEAIRAARKTALRLSHLASQLLNLARAEPAGRRPRHDDVDLAAAARQVLESLAPKAVERRIDLGLEAPEPVHVGGDGAMLKEMIANLVDNALTYPPPGSIVTVHVRREAERAVVAVIDNGPGVPAKERGLVFERFYRGEGRSEEGSGIGLAIVREVAAGAGGEVLLKETPGGGLTIEVRLPAGREARETERPAGRSSSQPA